MNNIQHYDPTAPVDRFSSTVRFRPVDFGVESTACTGRKVSAAERPAKVSETLKDGEGQNVAIASTASREEHVALQLQTSTIDHAESPGKSGIQHQSLCTPTDYERKTHPGLPIVTITPVTVTITCLMMTAMIAMTTIPCTASSLPT
jgi:hypothetical protein